MSVAIVTGSTRGIGKQVAIDLAKKGYNVVINYNMNESKALEVKALCDEYCESLIVQADISKFEDCENLANKAVEKFGSIDVLVNNAGITKDNLILRMSKEDYLNVINTNLNGTFFMCKIVGKIMMKQRKGKIINMASVVGEVGNVGQANYSASKGGVIALTKSLAKELAPRGILVNAVAPGFIDTDMTNVLGEDIKTNILNQIPLKRFGAPSDVSNLICFLASDLNNYITGQVINVCGGMVM